MLYTRLERRGKFAETVSAVSTIYDIAKAAGTSPASVSRVINNRGGVHPDKVRRIKQAMESLDFHPRWKAPDRNRLLIFVPDHKHTLESGYIAAIVSGITDAAFASGFGVQLRPFSARGKNAQDLRQLFMQEAVAGCILIAMSPGYTIPSQLGVAGLPHVVVGHKVQDDGVHQILLDDAPAGREAAEFLLSLGHKRVAMVSFSHADLGHRDRYRGFAEAMKKAGVTKPFCLQCSDSTPEAGQAAARQLLSPLDRPSAVIITNENIAAGFQSEAKLMGLSIPRELSIVAFEETDRLQWLEPSLTAMRIPAYAMGAEAVMRLSVVLSQPEPVKGKKDREGGVPAATQYLPIPLVARRSTAAA